MRHPKLESVRQHYQRACGYCGVTEAAAGSELTVDPYRPRAAGGGDDDDNLVYACVRKVESERRRAVALAREKE